MEKLFKITKDTKKSIRMKSKPLSLPLSDELTELGIEMLNYIKASQDEDYCFENNIRSGVGLAAPQIGRNINLIAIYLEVENGEPYQYVLANPRIIEESVQLIALEHGEGCLSVEGEHKGIVYRHNKIKVTAYDVLAKKNVEISATGMISIVLQHEIDHLSGILFYDRINKLEQGIKEGTILL
ncbi:MAG: peptide deformylase [Bacilli bacterium]